MLDDMDKMDTLMETIHSDRFHFCGDRDRSMRKSIGGIAE